MCLRVGRGGHYRSKKYEAEVRYLWIGLFTDSSGKVVDFSIGVEKTMMKGKMPLIEKCGAKATVIGGAGSIKTVVYKLAKNNIKPAINTSGNRQTIRNGERKRAVLCGWPSQKERFPLSRGCLGRKQPAGRRRACMRGFAQSSCFLMVLCQHCGNEKRQVAAAASRSMVCLFL